MRRCNFAARAGWVRWVEPSAPDTSRGGTYSADQSTWVGLGTIATPDERGTTTTLPFFRSCMRALASALRWRRGGPEGPDSNVRKSGPPLQDFNAKCNPLAYATAFCATAPVDAIYMMLPHSRIHLQKNGLGHRVIEDSDGGLGH